MNNFETLIMGRAIERETEKAFGVVNPAYAEAYNLHQIGGTAEVMLRGSYEARQAWKENLKLIWLPKAHCESCGIQVVKIAGWLAKKTGMATVEATEASKARFQAGSDRYTALLEQAKAAGVKGVRVGMKMATIKARMIEAGLSV